MTDNPDELQDLVLQRGILLNTIKDKKEELKLIEQQILEKTKPMIDAAYIHANKTHGDLTVSTPDGFNIKTSITKTVTYDQECMEKAARQIKNFEDVKRLFKIKWFMSESDYNTLCQLATHDDMYSDTLSFVDDARLVKTGDIKIKEIGVRIDVDV